MQQPDRDREQQAEHETDQNRNHGGPDEEISESSVQGDDGSADYDDQHFPERRHTGFRVNLIVAAGFGVTAEIMFRSHLM
ncbi:hypothetical protein ACWKSP_21920 [Micromonosporaceae bacterium Da 78-11]